MTEEPITAKDIEEAFGKVDFKKLIRDVILETGAEELLMPASYGNRFADIVSYEENGDEYIVVHPEVYKSMSRIKFELSKATERTLFGRKYNSKKIKRRLSYDVYYWTKTDRVSKYFESAKKAKNYVNYIHNSNLIEDGEVVEMVKTWCYREFTPRHKWYYISEDPNHFVCVEKW